MKSRFTIAMITVGGLSSLGLVAFWADGVPEGTANAQRINFAELERTPALLAEDAVPGYAVPANAAPTIYDNNPLAPVEPSRAATLPTQRNGFDSYDTQPPIPLAVSSSQPIVVAIKDGPQLKGETVNLGAFQFKTIFGMVSIPVDTMTGLRMADEPRQPATICLSNGDSLTGTLVTDSVTIKTAWGGATIVRDQIVSIVTTTKPVTWQQYEGRWRIILAEPKNSETEVDDAAARSGGRDVADLPTPIESKAAPATSTTRPSPPTDDPGIKSET